VASVFIAIFSTFVLTCMGCYVIYSRKLAEQKKYYEARMGELLNRLHHAGMIKAGASLAGLIPLISWALNRCIEQFVRHLNHKEWNTRAAIIELQAITENEFSLVLKLFNEFLKSGRAIFKEYDKDQGLPPNTPNE
jgi:hypothetical protein